MDSKSESVSNGSVGNDGVRSDRLSEDRGLHGEAVVQNSGSYNVQNSNDDDDEKGEGNTVGNSSPGITNYPSSPSPTVTRKGYGLRKWKRIDRSAAKSSGGSGNIDASQFIREDRSNSGVNPSKRMHYVEKESSENSVSSTNAMVKNKEGFSLPGEPNLGTEALFGAGTDSDNSEDRSSKSSTAASGQPPKYDKNRLRSLSGKNLTHSGNRGQQGKVRAEEIKKPKEGSMEILKETSVSSLESDSCSSNFVSMPEESSLNNGMGGEKQFDCDGENDKERNSGEGSENVSPDTVTDSSTEVKVDGKEADDLSGDKDPIVEATQSLQYAHELLEKELLKSREIRKHIEDSISDIHREAAADEQNLQETSSEAFSENQEVENEVELLFKNKIEAEVDYLTISSMARELREYALASGETQIMEKLTDSRNKAAVLNKNEAEEFEKVREEPSKLHRKICRNATYFFLQMVLLAFVVGIFILKSRSYEDFVPT